MYETFRDEKRIYMVTEISKGGDLYKRIIDKDRISEESTAVLMHQLLWCVNYIHGKGIVHRDLKPENILLEAKKDYDQIKIIDFGTASFLEEGEYLKDKTGTSYYMAPEVIEKKYDFKCDIWSCGVIAFLMISGTPPFDGQTD